MIFRLLRLQFMICKGVFNRVFIFRCFFWIIYHICLKHDMQVKENIAKLLFYVTAILRGLRIFAEDSNPVTFFRS